MFHMEHSKVRVLGNNVGKLYHLVYRKRSCKSFFAQCFGTITLIWCVNKKYKNLRH